MHNLENNSRFFDEVRLFEIGTVFLRDKDCVDERMHLGLGIRGKDSARELKGLADMLLGRLGITEYETREVNSGELKFMVDEKEVGSLILHPDLKNAAIAEFDIVPLLSLVSEEREFVPLPKFPSIVRDLSVFVPADVRVGEILAMIQRVSSDLVQDVDLIDFYEPPFESRDRSKEDQRRRKSLTFRIVFQAKDRTLTDAEADREMAAINQVVIDRFDAELR
jgi:phenylalanyl-tRNA synthetase beta chain